MLRSSFLRLAVTAALVGFVDIRNLVPEVATTGPIVVDGGMGVAKDVVYDIDEPSFKRWKPYRLPSRTYIVDQGLADMMGEDAVRRIEGS